jgi:hypothetical protein
MTHYECQFCDHAWDTVEPRSMEIDADTPPAVVDVFLFPDTCPMCGGWENRKDDDECRLAAEEFAKASPERRDQMIEMVRQAGRSIRGYWMGEMLEWGTVEYEDMSDEQKRIVDAGDEIVGQFPEGLTKEQLAAWIRERFAADCS